MEVPTIQLSDGHQMPSVGLGTWLSKTNGELKQAVEDAIEIGYRHIDCALIYRNETEVGQGIRSKIADGSVLRNQLFVTSKVWNTFHSFNKVEEAVRLSLANLGLDYLDLCLIHWPMGYQENGSVLPRDADGNYLYSDVDFVETWRGLERCVELGLTRSIGVSNFNSHQLQRILDHCTIKPVVNQIECHPYLNNASLIRFCHERGIAVTAYSPLGSPERPWAKPDEPVLLKDARLNELAIKYGRSVVQIALRYQTQRGLAVIPKSVKKSHVAQNLRCTDFDLSHQDMLYIDSLDRDCRTCAFEWVKDHPHYPFTLDEGKAVIVSKTQHIIAQNIRDKKKDAHPAGFKRNVPERIR